MITEYKNNVKTAFDIKILSLDIKNENSSIEKDQNL